AEERMLRNRAYAAGDCWNRRAGR
ncbi:MAG: hypothetical protein AVDCRST_MAG72-753, partial [uncultured Nocardioidaceae bacterium]